MARILINLAAVSLLLGNMGAVARSSVEPLSGIPLRPGFQRTADPIESYKYCGKNASIVLYVGDQMTDIDQKNAWYAHAFPDAKAFVASTGVKTFVKADGTAAVETAGAFISFFKFTPGLTPSEMKILGANPAARNCTAD
jgi:hypothetical protein